MKNSSNNLFVEDCNPSECKHCGLPVPSEWQKKEQDCFCCLGCQTVYRLLHSTCELPTDDLLKKREEKFLQTSRTTTYEVMDSPEFLHHYAHALPQGVWRIPLHLEGVHCGACIWLVEKLPQFVQGVLSASLNLQSSILTLTWDANQVALSRISRFLHGLGYPVFPFKEDEKAKIRQEERKRILLRLTVAGACAGNVMLLSFALYSGMFETISQDFQQFFRILSLVLLLPSIFYSARPFYTHAWASIQTKTIHIDLPIAIGISVGLVSGLINVIRGTGEIYFDSIATLIFFLLAGRWLQHFQQRKALDQTEKLFRLVPFHARKVENEQKRLVPVESLQQLDCVEVVAGETIPVDGMIVLGKSLVDESILTGESKPIPVTVGQRVYSGSVNTEATLQIQVDAVGTQTRMQKILELVQEESLKRPRVIQFADKAAGVLISTVLLLSVFTLLGWGFTVSWNVAIENTVALLIITCPCALGLATPLSLSLSLGRAAQQGILVKGGEFFEKMLTPGILWFDKTGTLTQGTPSLLSWKGDEKWKPYVQAIESHVQHPLAKALSKQLPTNEDLQKQCKEVELLLGKGVQGKIAQESFFIGSFQWMQEQNKVFPAWLDQELSGITSQGNSPVLVAKGQEVVALFSTGDALHPDTLPTLEKLKKQGWSLGILSGDHPQVVDHLVREHPSLFLHAFGGLWPEQKVQQIEKHRQQFPVSIMVGDGVNDSAALAAADVGISVHGGAEMSLAHADLFFSSNGLSPLLALEKGSRQTQKNILFSFFFSLCYNLLGAGLAISGSLNPLLAAIAMPISSLMVVTIALHSQAFKES